mgnify:CR=1 FL=1
MKFLTTVTDVNGNVLDDSKPLVTDLKNATNTKDPDSSNDESSSSSDSDHDSKESSSDA